MGLFRGRIRQELYYALRRCRLELLRWRAMTAPRHIPGRIRLDGYFIEYVDFLSLYMEYKDIFFRGIYHFHSETPSPLIFDGGGCIGMATLYFKKLYPQGVVICFEPDEALCKVLEHNISGNGLKNVQIVRAGLGRKEEIAGFLPDGSDGGRVVPEGRGISVPMVRLSRYIHRSADFLKLNIEGNELPVLQELEEEGKLREVKQLALEYHGWPNDEPHLGAILELLERNGFLYVVHDFDSQTNPVSKPPFKRATKRDVPWFCLVFGWRQ